MLIDSPVWGSYADIDKECSFIVLTSASDVNYELFKRQATNIWMKKPHNYHLSDQGCIHFIKCGVNVWSKALKLRFLCGARNRDRVRFFLLRAIYSPRVRSYLL